MKRDPRRWLAVASIGLLFAPAVQARTVRVPAGTTVFCRLDEEVTSRKKDTEQGDDVHASVWRDVVVDGVVVIPAGAPVRARVSMVRSAKIAGVQGKLEIAAGGVQAVDGQDLKLEGGYDKRGRGRKAVSITLAAVVLWPLIFIKGKQAVLPEGTVFDSYTEHDRDVTVEAADRRVVKLDRSGPGLDVEVLYDELEKDEKIKDLPMRVTLCGGGSEMPPLRIDTINGEKAAPVFALEVAGAKPSEDCVEARAAVALKPFGEKLGKGINTYEVAADLDGRRISKEVVLEIEF